MSIEALKAQLAEGKITQEQFTIELKKLLDAKTITQEEHDAALNSNGSGGTGGQGSNNGGGLSKEDVEKMLQSATDKIRTEYSQKLKAAQDEAERLKKEKMSEEEKAKYELEQLKKANENAAAELLREKVAFHTVKTLAANELPADFAEFLNGKDIAETDVRINAFKTKWQTALDAAVNARFKTGGGDPNKGKDGNGGGTIPNPWAKETFNLTKQAQLIRENPQLAVSYASAAGHTLNL